MLSSGQGDPQVSTAGRRFDHHHTAAAAAAAGVGAAEPNLLHLLSTRQVCAPTWGRRAER